MRRNKLKIKALPNSSSCITDSRNSVANKRCANLSAFDQTDADCWLTACSRRLLQTPTELLSDKALAHLARLLALAAQWTDGRMPDYPERTAVERRMRDILPAIDSMKRTAADHLSAYRLHTAALELREALSPVCDAAAIADSDAAYALATAADMPPACRAAALFNLYLQTADEAALNESHDLARTLAAPYAAGCKTLTDADIETLYALLPIYIFNKDNTLPRLDDVARLCFAKPHEFDLTDATGLQRCHLVFAALERRSTATFQDSIDAAVACC